MHARLLITMGWCAVWLAGSVRGDDWPQFRGPGSSAIADTKLPAEWGAEKSVLWKAKIPGTGWSSPIVWGDRVFVTAAVTDNQRKPQAGGGFGGGGGPPFGGGPGGGRGFGAPPQPGQILPATVQEQLKVSAEQKKQLEELQAEVNDKLAKVLNDEQKKQLKDSAGGGPGGGGPGRGGFGGGGGRPPDAVYRWQVFCLDRATGNVVWKQLALEAKPRIATHGSNTYATETPVTDGERVYAYFGMHGLFCYDFAGKLVWKKDLGSHPTQMGWGTASSPVLEGERLFVQVDNEENSFLVALDRKTGDELWRSPRSERTTWGSPIIWKNKQRTELVTPGSQKVRSYDPNNGQILWELSLGGGQCSATPVGDDSHLYFGMAARGGGFGGGPGGPPDGGGRRGGPGGGGGSSSLFAVKAGASGDITPKDGASTSTGVAWSQPKAGPAMASPLVYQGYVYILEQNGGMVSCYDAKTGKPAYQRERLPGARSFWASPWGSDGKVFCLDDAGTTHVLQAGPEFKVLGKNSLDAMVWASPAIAGGALFLRSVDHVYCIK